MHDVHHTFSLYNVYGCNPSLWNYKSEFLEKKKRYCNFYHHNGQVVMGENTTFVGESIDLYFSVTIPRSYYVGGEQILKDAGVEVVNLGEPLQASTTLPLVINELTDLPECKEMMNDFITAKPDVWNEDIGEE